VQAYQGGLASDDSDDEPEASQDQVPQEDGQTKDDDEAEDAPIVRNQRSIGIRHIEDQVRIMARRNREQEEAMQVSFRDDVGRTILIFLPTARTSRSNLTACRCPPPLWTRTPIKKSHKSQSVAVAMNIRRSAEGFVPVVLHAGKLN
jgi:hypothetical protein